MTPDDCAQALARHVRERTNSQNGTSSNDQERWKAVQRRVLVRNLFLFDELHRVLERLNAAAIEVVVLKGAALAEQLYPQGLRSFGDIDLLVRRESVPQAVEVLSASGYRPYGPLPHPGGEDFRGEVACVKESERPAMIDLHWTIGPQHSYSGRLKPDDLWKRAAKARVAGVNALVLCREDMLLHLCLHLFHHSGDAYLTSACDIAELIYQYQDELDWESFLSRVFEYDVCLPVRYGLRKTVELFQPPVPRLVLERLETYRPGRLERAIFALATKAVGPRSGCKYLARFLAMPGFKLRLRYLAICLFPPREFLLNRYGGGKARIWPVYYLRHWTEAVATALAAFLALLFPGKKS